MAGHSQFKNIMFRKGKQDAQRSKLFSKLSREITVSAKLGMPEVRFGIPSGMEACLLPRLVGWGKTCELIYTGEPMDAAEAWRCGSKPRSRRSQP